MSIFDALTNAVAAAGLGTMPVPKPVKQPKIKPNPSIRLAPSGYAPLGNVRPAVANVRRGFFEDPNSGSGWSFQNPAGRVVPALHSPTLNERVLTDQGRMTAGAYLQGKQMYNPMTTNLANAISLPYSNADIAKVGLGSFVPNVYDYNEPHGNAHHTAPVVFGRHGFSPPMGTIAEGNSDPNIIQRGWDWLGSPEATAATQRNANVASAMLGAVAPFGFSKLAKAQKAIGPAREMLQLGRGADVAREAIIPPYYGPTPSTPTNPIAALADNAIEEILGSQSAQYPPLFKKFVDAENRFGSGSQRSIERQIKTLTEMKATPDEIDQVIKMMHRPSGGATGKVRGNEHVGDLFDVYDLLDMIRRGRS